MNTKYRLMTIGGLALSVGSVVAGSAVTSGAIGGSDPAADTVMITSLTPDPNGGDGLIACTVEADTTLTLAPIDGAELAVAGVAAGGGQSAVPEGADEGYAIEVSGDASVAAEGAVEIHAATDLGSADVVASVAVGADGAPVYSANVREGTPEECKNVELPTLAEPVPAPAPANTEG